MKKIVSLLFVSMMVLIGLSFGGCSEKSQVLKNNNGEVIYNLDGTPVVKTVYVGVITGKQYSKDALQDAYSLGKGVYVLGREVVALNADLFTDEQITRLRNINDVTKRIDATKRIIDTMGKLEKDALKKSTLE